MVAEVVPFPLVLSGDRALAEARDLIETAYEITDSEDVARALVDADARLEAVAYYLAACEDAAEAR